MKDKIKDRRLLNVKVILMVIGVLMVLYNVYVAVKLYSLGILYPRDVENKVIYSIGFFSTGLFGIIVFLCSLWLIPTKISLDGFPEKAQENSTDLNKR